MGAGAHNAYAGPSRRLRRCPPVSRKLKGMTMAVREIKADGTVLARLITTESWEQGLRFHSGDEDFLQVGTWVYGAGKNLLPHAHNHVPRTVTRTHELIYVRRGQLRSYIYDESRELVEELVLGEGDMLVLLRGGHGYKILENDTQVLEVKNGPYLGADVDRTRF